MISKINSIFEKNNLLLSILLLISILFLGFYLRHYNYLTYPRHGATFDEYAWTWLGVNLIKEKTPISWSPQPFYENVEEIRHEGAAFLLVEPYLEHPPFFGLVAGSFAILRGAEDMYDVTLHKIRPLALLLGTFSILMLFFLSDTIYGRKVALLSSLLYATIPTVVIGSRLVQNENFFIPFWLLALLLTLKFLKTGNGIYRNIAAIICGLLVLAKIPWVAGGISIILILLFVKKYRDIFRFLLIFVPIGLVYFLYGFYFDKDLFLSLWGLQLNRYDIYFTSIYAIFQKPLLADRFYLDGWIFFGWFSLIILFLKDQKKHVFLVSAVVSYFLIFLTGIPDEAGHGWYRYPFIPFLTLSTALFIKEYLAKNFLLTFFFVVFVGTSLLQLTWAQVFGFSYTFFRIIILSWILILIPYFLKIKLTKRVGGYASYIWFVLLILMNVWAIIIYIE